MSLIYLELIYTHDRRDNVVSHFFIWILIFPNIVCLKAIFSEMLIFNLYFKKSYGIAGCGYMSIFFYCFNLLVCNYSSIAILLL